MLHHHKILSNNSRIYVYTYINLIFSLVNNVNSPIGNGKRSVYAHADFRCVALNSLLRVKGMARTDNKINKVDNKDVECEGANAAFDQIQNSLKTRCDS